MPIDTDDTTCNIVSAQSIAGLRRSEHIADTLTGFHWLRAHQVQTGGHHIPSSSQHCTSVLIGPAAVRCWSVVETPRPAELVYLQSAPLPSIATCHCRRSLFCWLLDHDSGTVYLSTSSLPHHSHHFVINWKHIYSGNHIQTLFFSWFAIVVLEVFFTLATLYSFKRNLQQTNSLLYLTHYVHVMQPKNVLHCCSVFYFLLAT